MAPSWFSVYQPLWRGHEGIRPKCGLIPYTPQQEAGTRIEPPPSLPTASGPIPAATWAAAPPDEPPGVHSRFHGLRVVPKTKLSVANLQPYSGVLVLPRMGQPAARKRSTSTASC